MDGCAVNSAPASGGPTGPAPVLTAALAPLLLDILGATRQVSQLKRVLKWSEAKVAQQELPAAARGGNQ